MGSAPSRPSEALAARLAANKEAAFKRAADLIGKADVFLLCTGAGFSADSGLAVYCDVAQVKAYKERNLQYHDICEPHWLQDEPELFWGFWGQCFNDYRRTPPHEGYEIIERWAEQHFRESPVAQAIRRSLQKKMPASDDEGARASHGDPIADAIERRENPSGRKPGQYEPYVVNDVPGAFFAFTSNVDAHHFDWFRAAEIRECHGNTELYQCVSMGCDSGIWRAPRDLSFVVDPDTMLAAAKPSAGPAAAKPGAGTAAAKPGAGKPKRSDSATRGKAGKAATAAAAESSPEASPGSQTSEDKAVPRIGQVRGGGRQHALRHMPGEQGTLAEAGFGTNHPVCPLCGGPARPAILMFGDGKWKDSEAQDQRWKTWRRAIVEQAELAGNVGSTLRVVILEIGAGCNVTTVRSTSESCFQHFASGGAEVNLIRVNPDHPLGDGEGFELEGGGDELTDSDLLSQNVLSIMGYGLDAIKGIDAAMTASPSQASPSQASPVSQ